MFFSFDYSQVTEFVYCLHMLLGRMKTQLVSAGKCCNICCPQLASRFLCYRIGGVMPRSFIISSWCHWHSLYCQRLWLKITMLLTILVTTRVSISFKAHSSKASNLLCMFLSFLIGFFTLNEPLLIFLACRRNPTECLCCVGKQKLTKIMKLKFTSKSLCTVKGW